MNFRKVIKILSITVLTIALWFAFCCFQVYTFSQKYFEKKSDVGIVLGAGTSNGEMSNIFIERMNHGIYLLKKNKIDYLIITGGYADGEELSDSKVAKNYAISKGIINQKILIEEKSATTFSNILNAKSIMTDLDLKNALIVSDPYHMKRSMKMCSKIGINALSSPTPTSMYRTKNTKRKFLINQGFNYCIYLMFEQFRKVKN